MKKAWLALAVGLLIPVVGAVAQDEMVYGAPEEMKILAAMDGEFDVAMEYRWEPGSDWQKTEGSASFKTKLDGSVQVMYFACEMMGMDFQGMGLTTYNRHSGKWQVTWTDNMGAKTSIYEGDMEGDKMITYGMDHMAGMDFHYRNTTQILGKDKMTWMQEMSMDGGKTYMEAAKAVYTRAAEEEEGGW